MIFGLSYKIFVVYTRPNVPTILIIDILTNLNIKI
jgi:hypothetical protein